MDEDKNPQFNPAEKTETAELTKKEKLAFWGLVILAVLVVYLGFRQMGNNLKTPFALFALKYSGGNAPEEKTEAQQLEELKKKDTDKDGLMDYDELYVYNTSPYLPDSDSDGTNDKQEIDAGADPNCPKGQNCFASEIANPVSGETPSSTLEQIVPSLPSSDQILLQNIFSANPDPKFLRDFLIKSGGKKELLDKFSDEELVGFFKEFITSSTSTLNTGTGKEVKDLSGLLGASLGTGAGGNIGKAATGTSVGAAFDINSIDLNALRQKLKEKGVPEETLKQLDDKTLLELIKQM